MIAIYSYVALQVLRLLHCVAPVAARCMPLHCVALGVQRGGATVGIGVQHLQRGATAISPSKWPRKWISPQVARSLQFARACAEEVLFSIQYNTNQQSMGCNGPIPHVEKT